MNKTTKLHAYVAARAPFRWYSIKYFLKYYFRYRGELTYSYILFTYFRLYICLYVFKDAFWNWTA